MESSDFSANSLSGILVKSRSLRVTDPVSDGKEGWLGKKSPSLHGAYQMRWVAVREGKLLYFSKKNETQPKGVINFSDYSHCEVQVKTKDDTKITLWQEDSHECLEQVDMNKTLKFSLMLQDEVGKLVREFKFKAPTQEEFREWILVICSNIEISKEIREEMIEQHGSSSASAFDENRKSSSDKSWKYERIDSDTIASQADTGDILLFESLDLISKAQRFFTLSDFDHISMFLRDQDETLFVIQAVSGKPLELYTWRDFITSYGDKYSKIFYRKLQFDRDPFAMIKLQTVLSHFSTMRASVSPDRLIVKNKELEDEFKDQKAIFSSELVAGCYKAMGLLQSDVAASWYWPRNFSVKKELKLLKGAELGAQLLVELKSYRTSLDESDLEDSFESRSRTYSLDSVKLGNTLPKDRKI